MHVCQSPSDSCFYSQGLLPRLTPMTLETIPLLRNLKAIELQALRLITRTKQIPAGTDIFLEGSPGDGLYFVKSGLIEISGGKTDRRVFSRLGPGEIFGEMAVIEHG